MLKVNISGFHKLFISIVLILCFVAILLCFFKLHSSVNTISKNIYSNYDYIKNLNSINSIDNSQRVKNTTTKKKSYSLYENIEAFLTIPVLNIYNAPISEGTSQSVMEKHIGHFNNTSYDIGNIGLASHNRGSGATYFQDLYKLKENDYIFYTYKNVTKRYIVSKIIVIDSYDWSYLENTTENKLTLITCINNKPNYRLCVQAVQM